MSSSTSELISALRSVAAGSEGAFRLERRARAVPGVDEQLVVAPGVVELSTARSISDASGEEIGVFRARLDGEALARIALAAANALAYPALPARTEAGEMRIELTVEAGRSRDARTLRPSDRAGLEPYQELLRELDAAAFHARQCPVRTLALELAIDPPRAGEPLTGTLTLRNTGSEGVWIDHPGSDAAFGTAILEYATEPSAPEGTTPLPPEVGTAPLRFVHSDEPRLWLDGHAAVTLPFSAAAALPPPPVLLRSSYERPAAPRVVDDQPRLGGCVFSAELRVEK